MKHLIVITFCLALAFPVSAQEDISEKFAIPLSSPGERGKVELSQINGDITVTGYTGKEVIITATAVGNAEDMNEDEGADKGVPPGMKKISANPLEITAKEKSNTVYINTQSWKRKINVEIQVPTKTDLELHTLHGTITVKNVSGALEVSGVNGKIDLSNISGSVISNTVNGGITVVFNSVQSGEPMSFVTLNGNVDVTLPAATKATAKLRSEQGEIYTDFDMTLDREKPNVKRDDGAYKVSINAWVYGKMNGGGPEYTFKNMNGNIIVRKGT